MNFEQIASQSKASIHKGDLEKLLRLLEPENIKYVLEIGTWKGYSAETWIRAFKPDKLVTIEKDPKFPDAIEIENINYKYFWNTDSHDNDIQFNTEPYDFAFLDADHSYEGVKKDWEMYGPLVKKGGVIVFHDVVYTSEDPNAPVQVKYLWSDLKTKYPYIEIKSGNESTGMGVLFV